MLIAVFSLASVGVDAKQRTKRKRVAKKTAVKNVDPSPTGYEYVDNDWPVEECKYPPMYPGGLPALMTFLKENMTYPPNAAMARIEGKVLVEFLVEKDGSIGNVRVMQSVDPSLDAEAMRVCRLIKNFIPAYNSDHEAVRSHFILPVNFKLYNPETQDTKSCVTQ